MNEPSGTESPGLRERKKRELRQHLSDTATHMFLERGFDQVRVSEVAAACGVSEKTVYNHFATKESLLLDREDSMAQTLREALSEPTGSPTQAMVQALAAELHEMDLMVDAQEWVQQMALGARFSQIMDGTPSLRAAQADMMDRLLRVAAEALAVRCDGDPDDPELQIAATALVGLWRVHFHAFGRRAEIGTDTPAQMRAAVIAEVQRAADVIERGLGSLDAAGGSSGRGSAARS